MKLVILPVVGFAAWIIIGRRRRLMIMEKIQRLIALDDSADVCRKDIMEHIISFLDKESRITLKPVSNEWNCVISARSRLPVKFTFAGIVLQDFTVDHMDSRDLRFLQLDYTGGATLCDSLEAGEDWVLPDTCNALILKIPRSWRGLGSP